MSRRIFITSFLTALSIFTNAQQIKPEVYKFGKTKLWNSPEAIFTFKNDSKQSVLFLPVAYNRNLMVILPQGYIDPGAKAEIKVRFYTEKEGLFNITVPVYINTLDEPFKLQLKGNIVSLHPSAITECPRIDKSRNEQKSESQFTITVIDKNTGKFLTGSDIYLQGTSKSYLLENTKMQQVPLFNINTGLYKLKVSKAGFTPEEEVVYINRNSGNIIFKLTPIPGYDPKKSPVVSKSVTRGDEFIELTNEAEDESEAIERIRKIMDEKFKGKVIIEKDVVVVKENPEDSASIVRMPPPDTKSDIEMGIIDKPDYEEDGSLNTEKFNFNNIVFLIDISASMDRADKLPLLKESIKNMVEVLRKEDLVTVIVYATKTGVVAASVPGNEKQRLFIIIDTLMASGSSHGGEGLKLAYDYAGKNFIVNGNNQVIMASDGLLNSKSITKDEILELAKLKSDEGIRTSAIAFGSSKEAIKFLKDISSKGKGSFLQMSNNADGAASLVEEIKKQSIRK
jgi:uncharacterized protein YegL